MIFNKEELLEMIQDYSEQMGLETPNESVLEEIETQYVYEPYNQSFILRITEGFLIVPLAFPEGADCELLLADAYSVDIMEIESILNTMRKGHEELVDMARGE